MLNTVEAQWNWFKTDVLKPELTGMTENELLERRKMFYAGAWAMFNLSSNTIGAEGMTEEAAISLLDGWQAECLNALSFVPSEAINAH